MCLWGARLCCLYPSNLKILFCRKAGWGRALCLFGCGRCSCSPSLHHWGKLSLVFCPTLNLFYAYNRGQRRRASVNSLCFCSHQGFYTLILVYTQFNNLLKILVEFFLHSCVVPRVSPLVLCHKVRQHLCFCLLRDVYLSLLFKATWWPCIFALVGSRKVMILYFIWILLLLFR